ncbi:MAG: hypothetical protein IT342_21110 [Candidatus Melainabacteria bacterium]|nr:hypothetical protein [Candidatus Melainabacteria bacterium]
MNNSNFFRWYGIRLLLVAFAIGMLSTSTASLVAYIGGNGLTDQPGAIAAFSIAYLIAGTIFSTIVHFFILAVASVFGLLGLAVVRGGRKNDPNTGGTPTPTADGDKALKAFGKTFVLIVLGLATLLAAYQSIGLFVLLSAVSQAAGLIVLATVMTFILSLVYGSAVIGFIGAVATFMVVMLVAFFGGRGTSATK